MYFAEQSIVLKDSSMSTFLIAYLIVWAGVLGYVVRLAAQQRRLLRTLESLQLQIQQSSRSAESATRAA
jgi:CcmD family protein